MADKPNALHTLGLEINPTTLKGAQVSLRKNKPVLDRLYEMEREFTPSQPENVKPLYTTEEGQALINAVGKTLVITTLNPGEAIVRQLEVKLKKAADIDAVLAFQAEPLLPYPADQALVDRVTLSETQEGTLLNVLAVRKDHLKHHLDLWHALDIEPEVVTCPPIALSAFSALFAPSDQPQFVVHIGSANCACVLVSDGKLLAAQACFQGVDQLIQAFNRDSEKGGHSSFNLDSAAQDAKAMQDFESESLLMRAEHSQKVKTAPIKSDYGSKDCVDLAFSTSRFNDLNFLTLHQEEFPALIEAIESLRQDLTRTLYALGKQAKGKEVTRILLTGEIGHLKNLSSSLFSAMNKPLIQPLPIPGFDLPQTTLERFALPIGSSLTALPEAKDEIDFRQGEFAYPNPWKRYKLPLALYLSLCLLMALAFYFLGNTYIKYQVDEVRRQYSALLESMHKPYTPFEKDYLAKLTGKKSGDEIPFATPLKELDQADIVGRLNYLDKELQSNPQSFPLLPNVPTVSDVLAWLASHPNVVAKDPKTGASKPLLQIETFNYAFVKRPEMTKKQEKYQVKVEIEFSSPTAKLAREFHDALIAPNAMVDPKGEVKWSTNRGLYRASFYLKDKTIYSS